MKIGIETERIDLFDVSINIAMRIHISGKVDEESLRDAFEKAGTNSRLAGKSYGWHSQSYNPCFRYRLQG